MTWKEYMLAWFCRHGFPWDVGREVACFVLALPDDATDEQIEAARSHAVIDRAVATECRDVLNSIEGIGACASYAGAIRRLANQRDEARADYAAIVCTLKDVGASAQDAPCADIRSLAVDAAARLATIRRLEAELAAIKGASPVTREELADAMRVAASHRQPGWTWQNAPEEIRWAWLTAADTALRLLRSPTDDTATQNAVAMEIHHALGRHVPKRLEVTPALGMALCEVASMRERAEAQRGPTDGDEVVRLKAELDAAEVSLSRAAQRNVAVRKERDELASQIDAARRALDESGIDTDGTLADGIARLTADVNATAEEMTADLRAELEAERERAKSAIRKWAAMNEERYNAVSANSDLKRLLARTGARLTEMTANHAAASEARVHAEAATEAALKTVADLRHALSEQARAFARLL